MSKPTGYWNCIERCREAAAKYKNRTDFFQGQAGAFMAAKRLGFLDEICAHMEELKKQTIGRVSALKRSMHSLIALKSSAKLTEVRMRLLAIMDGGLTFGMERKGLHNGKGEEEK